MNKSIHLTRTGRALLALIAATASSTLAVTPASVFTDNMVLQRGQPVPIWGTAAPGSSVQVRLGDAEASAIADKSGNWIAILDSLPASDVSRTLEIRSGEGSVMLTDVLVGDVWLCAGQSNMQMTLGESAGGKEFAQAHGNNRRIRLLTVPKLFTSNAHTSQAGKWVVATVEVAMQFSAVGFSFGADLARSPTLSKVPIGLIDSSFGGTTVEGWIAHDDLESFDAKYLADSMFGKPSEHYNAMVHPLIPMAIRGVIWYQGESNSDRPAAYGKLLRTLIRTWRRDFRQPELPFILVQLPAYNAPFQEKFFTWIREQQSRVAAEVKGVSLVVTYDTHDGYELHPPEKIPIGTRAARAARGTVYEEPLVVSGPAYASHSIEGAQVRVKFDTHGERLITSDGAERVRGFQLAGSQEQFHFASGTIIDGDTVIVSAPGVREPRNVRFAWAGVPGANLASSAHLPAAPFRTDALPPEDLEFVHVPTHRAVKTAHYELEINAIGSLRSLGVGGEQFIANELGMNGGSCIPTMFGPRNLNQVSEVGPRQLVFSDAETSLSYSFGPDTVRIHIANKSTSECAFQIALAAGVSKESDKPLRLKKNGAIIQVDGCDVSDTPPGAQLLLKAVVPAGKSRSVRLELGAGN